MSSLIGRTIGQYQITEVLGKGGMATVYKGYQASVGRSVAIKVLPPHPGLDERFIERFELEAKTIGQLQNPHILPLYDYGRTSDDILYLAMAFIDSGTLADEIERGPMSLERIEYLVRQIASALDYAHRRGVIHRDIKPGNILIDSDGNALLADFGIVKMLSNTATGITGTAVLGTPAYMSPEQAHGVEIDARADIYALGVMVYEMLTGEQPFKADTPMQIILRHVNDAVPDLRTINSDLPSNINDVIQTAMAKDPNDRFATVIEFAEALTNAIHNRDESREVARKAMPLERHTANDPTTVLEPPTVMSSTMPSPTAEQTGSSTQPQTVIIRERTNVFAILGGFAVVALAIVVVAVLIMNTLNNSPEAAPTEIAQNTDVPVEATGIPTEEPTIIPTVNLGRVRYGNASGLGDTLSLSAQNLRPATGGDVYAAWLYNTDTDEQLPIGELRTDASGFGVLAYTSDEGVMLPALYNAILITEQEEMSETPTGTVVYSASVPIEVSNALRSIFVEDPRSICINNGEECSSLIVAAKTEAATAETHSGLAAGSSNVGGMGTHAEHTINILRGTLEDLNGDERPENPGRQFGVFAALDLMEEALSAALAADPGNSDLQTNAESLRVCLFNSRERADEIIELETTLLTAETVESVLADAERAGELAEQLTTGFDLNQNGTIEPFEGECGLDQIADYGIEFGNLTLKEGGLDAQ
ncbi:MAG: hypothetical protein CL607_20980 [Anaerolineaceae bacterium]|nr:hypothetical protein [Anaerolineaceae bacterium]